MYAQRGGYLENVQMYARGEGVQYSMKLSVRTFEWPRAVFSLNNAATLFRNPNFKMRPSLQYEKLDLHNAFSSQLSITKNV